MIRRCWYVIINRCRKRLLQVCSSKYEPMRRTNEKKTPKGATAR